MPYTPLIKKIKSNGTLVTFQSSGEDWSSTSLNSSRRMDFSRYALIKIPPIETPVSNSNSIQFDAPEGSFINGLSNDSPSPEGDRTDLAQSLQNYLLNLEAVILNSESYDPQLDLNISERIFFKWLKEVGAMRFREANNGEKVDTLTEKRFVEEDISTSGTVYDPIVKFIGELDVMGVQRYNANTYRQLYLFVPTQSGGTPDVLFKSVSDSNYGPGRSYSPRSNENIEYIQGRSASDDPTRAGLTVSAFYDQDVALGGVTYKMDGVDDEIWFKDQAPNGPNVYHTDAAFDDPGNNDIERTGLGRQVSYRRSKLDGVCIDWNSANYKAFQDNSTFKSFHDFNQSASAGDFEFNAVLLYYDVYNESTPEQRTTNLYGVLFLDDLENVSTGGAKITSILKVKPDRALRKNGNAFGITVNLKSDVTSDAVDSEVEVSVNDYNTFSMVLFTEAMQKVSLMNRNYEKASLELKAAIENVNKIESLILTGNTSEQILQEISAIRSQIADIETSQGITALIDSLEQRVSNIENGTSAVPITALIDLEGRDGIKVLKETPTSTITNIRNLRQRYSKVSKVDLDTTGRSDILGNVLEIGEWDTLVVHQAGGITKTVEGNMQIYLKDSPNTWKDNQSMRIVFQDPVQFGVYGAVIYTDALNTSQSTGPYTKLVGTVVNIKSETPTIEIICTSAKNFEFIVLLH